MGLNRSDTILAGQLIGVEGYVESAAMGILAGVFMDAKLNGKDIPNVPLETIIGSLHNYVTSGNKDTYSPMNANFGILYGSNKHNREESIEKSLKLIDTFWGSINERN